MQLCCIVMIVCGCIRDKDEEVLASNPGVEASGCGLRLDDARSRCADILIDPSEIEFLKDSLGLSHIIGKGAFGHVRFLSVTRVNFGIGSNLRDRVKYREGDG